MAVVSAHAALYFVVGPVRMVAYRRCISQFHATVSACLLRKSVCWAQPCQTVSHKKAEIDVMHLSRCCLPSGQAAAAEMWRAPCCTRRAGRGRRVVRYHALIEQACAAEMWRMPFCKHGQCRPVLQRCGTRYIL